MSEPIPPATFRVRATRLGWYDSVLRSPGEVFDISGPEAFSEAWMEKVYYNLPLTVAGLKHGNRLHALDSREAQRLDSRDDVVPFVPE